VPVRGERKERCIRGHNLLNKANVQERWVKGGYLQRECKLCISIRRKKKYRSDPVHREKLLQRGRSNWKKVREKRDEEGGASRHELSNGPGS
jgi:hypothetical protein